MADGLNQARALRIIEITTDYQRLQHQLASFRSYLVGPHTQGEGYVLLQACLNEAQTLLAHPFNTSAIHPRGNEEVEKTQLRQVLMDASIRRFKAQKLYMRAVAAVHWIHARNGILKDQPPRFEHADPLRRISVMYRQELSRITDAQAEYMLRSIDASQGKWLVEDPSITVLIQMTRLQR